MKFLSDETISSLLRADEACCPSPAPTQIASRDEYMPAPLRRPIQPTCTGIASSEAPALRERRPPNW